MMRAKLSGVRSRRHPWFRPPRFLTATRHRPLPRPRSSQPRRPTGSGGSATTTPRRTTPSSTRCSAGTSRPRIVRPRVPCRPSSSSWVCVSFLPAVSNQMTKAQPSRQRLQPQRPPDHRQAPPLQKQAARLQIQGSILALFIAGNFGRQHEVVAAYDRLNEGALKRLQALPASRWEGPVPFVYQGTEVMKETGYDNAWGFLLDIIHHRGQLSTYLRPMGAKVPQIYGPSADEPM